MRESRSGPRPACYPPAVASASSFALPRFGRGPLVYSLTIALINMLIADQPYAAHLVLGSGFVLDQEYWQPLSALFLYPEGRIDGLIGTFLIQWIIGTSVADRLGLRRYFALLLGAGLCGTLTLALLGLALPSALATTVGGSLPGDLAAVVAFGVLFDRRQLRLFGALPLTARSLSLIIAGLALLAPPLRGASWSIVVVHAAAMTSAFLAIARPWRRGPRSGKVGTGRPPKKRKANHLRLVN